jgi:hypothetical protein
LSSLIQTRRRIRSQFEYDAQIQHARERERGERSALVVGTADDVGLVTTGEVLDSVDTLIVAFQSEVGNGRAQTPHLDTAEKLDG